MAGARKELADDAVANPGPESLALTACESDLLTPHLLLVPHPHATMSSPDPYDPYNFTEFSDADLIALDAGVTLTGDTAASAAPAPRPNGGPIHLAVALDEASDAVQSDSSYVKPGSPYALYRAWRQVLSVTDLASPQW
jgi:hypothetical protein